MAKIPLFRFFSILCFVLLLVGDVVAQPPDPQNGSDPDVPITGIEILLGVGGLLGVRRIWQRNKEK